MADDLLFRPLIDLARDLRTTQVTAPELIEAAIARHERFGKRLHAYSHWAPKQASAVAQAADAAFAAGVTVGPLQGLPVSIKDLFAASGYPCFAGSSRRLPADPWERDGPLVATLRGQFGVIMGKTHMVEFAFGGTGHNGHWGAPYNPWDAAAHRSVGGSSSGAGVSLLEGSAALALGSDTAGSVRIPASMTGTVGLKVTLGRWSTDGVVPLSPTFDTPGLLARSVSDTAYGFAALDPAGIDPAGFIARAGTRDLAGVRIGVGDPFLWRDCDPGIAETAEEAVNALGRAGAVTREFALPEVEAAYAIFLQGSLSAVELRSFLDLELPDWLPQLDPVIAPAVRNAESVSARDYLARLARLRALARTAAPRLDAVDVIASPTLCLTPPIDGRGRRSRQPPAGQPPHRPQHGRGQLSRLLRNHDAGRARSRRHAGRAPIDRAGGL
jgi:aspartyl-tRNA(Asn)/glutamyl-tRNA(Gln) amidotransferase subunit A